MSDHAAPAMNRRDAIGWLMASLSAAVLGIAFPSCRPAALPSGSQGSQGDPSESIPRYLSRLEGFGFSGAVLVGRAGEVLVESTHGLADPGINWGASHAGIATARTHVSQSRRWRPAVRCGT